MRQIILKDDGSIAVYSIIIDQIVYEGDIDLYIKTASEAAANKKADEIRDTINDIKSGKNPYGPLKKTYEQATYGIVVKSGEKW